MENKILSTAKSAIGAIRKWPRKDKIILGIVICLSVIALIILFSDPIILDIRIDADANTIEETGKVYTFYGPTRDVYYYLADGSSALFDVTVIYLNRRSENLCDAMQEGRVTTDDLDRFGIEYGIIQK